MRLHKKGPCSLCCDAGDDFDYCRACGFTVLDITIEPKEPEESNLAKAVKMARGGEPPIRFKGYA